MYISDFRRVGKLPYEIEGNRGLFYYGIYHVVELGAEIDNVLIFCIFIVKKL